MLDFILAFFHGIIEESLPILIGDCCIVAGFLIEGIDIIKSKTLSRTALAAYLMFTLGSMMWLVYGIISGSLWIRLANATAITIQFSVLFVIFYLTVIKHSRHFAKITKKIKIPININAR